MRAVLLVATCVLGCGGGMAGGDDEGSADVDAGQTGGGP